MKNKIWSILLGAVLLLTMLPVGVMATESTTPVTNLIVNGTFEDGLTGGVPGENWVKQMQASTLVYGNIEVMESDTIGTENTKTITPAVADSTKFLKLSKIETDTSRAARIYFPISTTTGFDMSKKYRLEAYINIPEAVTNVGFHFAPANAADRDGIRLGVGEAFMDEATEGWTKIYYDFTFDSMPTNETEVYLNMKIKGTAAGVVYFDEIKVYEIKDDNSLLTNSCHYNFGQSVAFMSADPVRSLEGTHFELANDPADSANYAVRINKAGDRAIPVMAPISLAGGYDMDDIYKIKFRMYVESAATPEGDVVILLRNTNYGSTASTKYTRASVTVPADKVNQWLDVEVITTGFSAASSNFGFEKNADYDYYIDDIEAYLLTDSYISNMNILNSFGALRVGTSGDRIWINAYTGYDNKGFSKTDVVKPLMVFAPNAEGDKGIGVIAVYKNNANVRTLVDIKLEDLSRTDAENLTDSALVPEEYGMIPATFSMDLSTLDLTEGNYSVDYLLWDDTTIFPLAKNVSIAVQ